MPVEIKELVIRAVVEPRSSNTDVDVSPSVPSTTAAPALSTTDRQALIQACVKEVMRHLDKSRER